MLVTYDAYMTFPEVAPALLKKMTDLAASFHLDVDLDAKSLEFTYSGRDSERRFIAFLKAFAPLVGTADGEVERIADENDDGNQTFEFYSIEDGKLYCQVGRIVREDRKLVG